LKDAAVATVAVVTAVPAIAAVAGGGNVPGISGAPAKTAVSRVAPSRPPMRSDLFRVADQTEIAGSGASDVQIFVRKLYYG
jgi:hypothetical protein